MRSFVLSVCALAVGATSVYAGNFTTVGSTIYDPSGNVFVAHGVNIPGYNNWVGHNPAPDASLVGDAWGFNLVRVNNQPIANWTAPGVNINIDNIINAYTNRPKPIVVMLEAHESTGTYWSGTQLQQVTQWFTNLATRYKNNPYVWFNVGNEPGNTFTPDKAAWETMHQTVIHAIRDVVGAQNMIVADGTCYGQDGAWDDRGTLNPANSAILSYGHDLTDFGGEHYNNILFDTHIYGMWTSPGSTPQRLEQYILAAKAQGLPQIFGEYNTQSSDATVQSATDLLALANKYNIGRAAWSWSDAGDQADLTTATDLTALGTSWATGGGYLINSTTNPTDLTQFGQMVWNDNHAVALVPEPTTGLALLGGLAILGGRRRRK